MKSLDLHKKMFANHNPYWSGGGLDINFFPKVFLLGIEQMI